MEKCSEGGDSEGSWFLHEICSAIAEVFASKSEIAAQLLPSYLNSRWPSETGTKKQEDQRRADGRIDGSAVMTLGRSQMLRISQPLRHSIVHPLKWRTQHLSTYFASVITVRQQQNPPASETYIVESVPPFMQLHHLGASGWKRVLILAIKRHNFIPLK